MIRMTSRGDYRKTINYLKHIDSNIDVLSILEKYGQIGVERLSEATPIESGVTAQSWNYGIEKVKNGYKINYYNTNSHEGYHIIVLLRYGHVTVDGRWIEGNDFVTPIIDQLCDEIKTEL